MSAVYIPGEVSFVAITLDHMRYFLLACSLAFNGKRGRSGVLGYLRGEATPSTVELGKQSGIYHLHGALKGIATPEVQSLLASLLTARLLEIRKVESKGKELPLLFITSSGDAELKRLSTLGLVPLNREGVTAEKMLAVLSTIAKLMSVLHTNAGLDEELCQYMDLLGPAIGADAEVHLGNLPARVRFAELLEKTLNAEVFAFLPEVEAQALRLVVGVKSRHQMSLDEMRGLYGDTDFTALARKAVARLAPKLWPHKGKLVSVVSFLAIARQETNTVRR